jgi:hypothetical protein
MISTLVSLSKSNINETIPGMQMANYCLPAEKDGSVLHIPDSYYYKPDIDGHQDRVFVPSAQIAKSLVQMHLTSQLEYKEGQHPAVFCIPELELSLADVKKNYSKEVLAALTAQRKWYVALVKVADDDWQRVKRHNMISDIQRIAARSLNLKREWLLAVENEENLGCPFCGTNLLNPEAPICPTCGKVHNPERLKALEQRLGVTTVKEPEKKQ